MQPAVRSTYVRCRWADWGEERVPVNLSFVEWTLELAFYAARSGTSKLGHASTAGGLRSGRSTIAPILTLGRTPAIT